MTTHEAIVVASLSAIMSVAGIRTLSPEAQEIADAVQLAARTQDWKLAYASEISGRDYFQGISSPVDLSQFSDVQFSDDPSTVDLSGFGSFESSDQ